VEASTSVMSPQPAKAKAGCRHEAQKHSAACHTNNTAGKHLRSNRSYSRFRFVTGFRKHLYSAELGCTNDLPGGYKLRMRSIPGIGLAGGMDM